MLRVGRAPLPPRTGLFALRYVIALLCLRQSPIFLASAGKSLQVDAGSLTGPSAAASFNPIVSSEEDEDLAAHLNSLPVKAALTLGDKPQLIALAAAPAGYSENSSVHLLCTISAGHHETLTFDWFKDGQLLPVASSSKLAPQIEKRADHSLLRIDNVKSQHAGRYTCTARNQFGLDSSSVNLAVNGN